ncbi:MAG: DUF4105 domain-containing protein [Bacteroidales bacterium]|nr:DUF4105 domain-containing protein [Bacteroidales bacterium]
MKVWLLTLMMWAGALCAWAQEVPDTTAVDSTEQKDQIFISLLTCSPGTEPYTLFGHTAIHMRNEGLKGFDYVFNYGLFDYSAKNFVWRFVKGETDYELGAEPTDFFMSRYVDEGHTVWEQELNLTTEEKKQLFALIVWNALPANKMYRYNFLYDNCTTRARDAFQRAMGEVRVAYPPNTDVLTFRDIIHGYTSVSPWVELGIDMVLGQEVDRPLDYRNRMFVPSRYHNLVKEAALEYPDGTVKPFVRKEKIWEPTQELKQTPGFPLSPVLTMWLVFALTVAVSAIDGYRRRVSLWLDVLLLGVQGVSGLLVAFLFFFSEHPAVGTNWLIVVLNPLVFALMLLMFKRRSRAYQVAEYVNLAGLVFGLLLFVLPLQQVPPALLPVVLSLLLRGSIRRKLSMNN